MIKSKIVIITTMMLLSAQVMAYTVSGGTPSGRYYEVGGNLATILGSSQVIKSKGSVENLDRLVSGDADVAPVQADALAWYQDKNPESKVEIIGSLYSECIHIAVNVNGKVTDEDHLQQSSKSPTIAIGKEGSGSSVTWDYMMKLEDGYSASAVEFSGGARALSKLAMSNSGIDAVMWVAEPSLTDTNLQIVNNSDSLMMIDVNDGDLNDTYEPMGRPVYTFQKIPTKDGLFSSGKVKVPCVETLLVARSAKSGEDLDEFYDELSTAVTSYKATLLARKK